jgi:ankyrin repeat protein
MSNTLSKLGLAILVLSLNILKASAITPFDTDEENLKKLSVQYTSQTSKAELTEALFLAAIEHHPLSFSWLVQQGADCDALNSRGATALIAATASLPKGKDVAEDERIAREFPGAEIVPWKGQEKIDQASAAVFRMAIECSKNLNTQIKGGFGAIHYAAQRKRLDAIIQLVKAGANINLGQNLGRTILMDADVRDLPILVKHGADINAKDLDGSTILHQAFDILSLRKLKNFVSIALSLGAKDSPDSRGKFASELGSPILGLGKESFDSDLAQLAALRKAVKETRQ